jgi:peptide/nickel transport system ATP-binding protein
MEADRTNAENSTLIEVRNLVVEFRLMQGILPAVNGVTFEINRGRTLGIVGESGCGKSVTALAILGLVPNPPGHITNGEVIFHRFSTGETIDLVRLKPRGPEMRNIRGNEIAMIFQEPMTSLTPAYTIGEQIMEAIILHQQVNKQEGRKRAIDVLNRVGMPQPSRTIDSYPHQLSGGMMQRAMIAIALSCHPSLLIADEPTTALDVTTAAQILELMESLQEELGMATMHITHNLGVVAEVADDVAVMYLGKIVERADVNSLFHDAKHPYTQGLLNSIPQIGAKKHLEPIRGVVPEPHAVPRGCAFGPRCPHFKAGTCDQADPPLVSLGPQREVSCYLYAEKG